MEEILKILFINRITSFWSLYKAINCVLFIERIYLYNTALSKLTQVTSEFVQTREKRLGLEYG